MTTPMNMNFASVDLITVSSNNSVAFQPGQLVNQILDASARTLA